MGKNLTSFLHVVKFSIRLFKKIKVITNMLLLILLAEASYTDIARYFLYYKF